MLDKFSAWQYRDDHNCWHFVRAWQIERCGVPESALPEHKGINPEDKRSMTKAAVLVMSEYSRCQPEEGAIACQFRDNVLLHVGVVHNGLIANVNKSKNRINNTIEEFRNGAKLRFYIYAKH